jgi:hypothetical protein
MRELVLQNHNGVVVLFRLFFKSSDSPASFFHFFEIPPRNGILKSLTEEWEKPNFSAQLLKSSEISVRNIAHLLF